MSKLRAQKNLSAQLQRGVRAEKVRTYPVTTLHASQDLLKGVSQKTPKLDVY